MKKIYIKKVLMAIVAAIAIIIIVCRIYIVNKNKRTPKVIVAEQGETLEYRGIDYTVVSAEIWDYHIFFDNHNALKEYEEVTSYERKILLVEIEINVVDEDNVFDFYIPIQYSHIFNGVDPFMVQDMNEAILSEGIKSGDTLVIPYELYRENVTGETWENIENMEMEYCLVLGTYPEKNLLYITEIENRQ